MVRLYTFNFSNNGYISSRGFVETQPAASPADDAKKFILSKEAP